MTTINSSPLRSLHRDFSSQNASVSVSLSHTNSANPELFYGSYLLQLELGRKSSTCVYYITCSNADLLVGQLLYSTFFSILVVVRFIYTSLGEGIIVCLSMLSGHMVATCISPCTLLAYVASVCSVLCLEATAFISIFYYIDWKDKFSIYIDVQDKNFGNFLRFNLTVSRFLLIITLVAQINAVIVAIILWAKGPEPRSHCCNFGIPEFKQSFLVLPDSPVLSSGGSSIGRDLEASK